MYLTLRSAADAAGGTETLEILDVKVALPPSDIAQPALTARTRYRMGTGEFESSLALAYEDGRWRIVGLRMIDAKRAPSSD